ncbi:hypothetical protein C2845_PM02G10920 [Panicum miliaceum]|uniref:Uncharacterized protein n=1 Tax=Panicum miliaceum TaxID=4540 RepID=A0A3L6SGI0_PANMI|nr:hypothetical protein C2845_PM02G10920 [Panicum miliaceum]
MAAGTATCPWEHQDPGTFGQDAPRLAPVVNQPHGHLMGQQARQPPPPPLPAYQMQGHQRTIMGPYGTAAVAGPLQIQGNPGQNAPPFAPAVNQPRGHLMGQQAGGRSFPHGLHLQAPTSLLAASAERRWHPQVPGNNQPPAQPISRKAMEWGKRMAASTGKLRFRDDTGQKAGGVQASMDLPPPQPSTNIPFDLNSTHNLLHPSVPACSSSGVSPRSATTRWGSTARRPEGTPPNSSIQCSPPTSPVPAPSMKMNSTAARPAVSIRRQCGLNHGGMSACALTASQTPSSVWCAPTISRGLLRFL